jgi:uroporphyrinogen-III synthase
MSFAGLRVLSLESRRAEEMETLVLRYQGEPFVAPSVKEKPMEDNAEVFAWAERLFAGDFDMGVFMTGVGLGYLKDALLTRHPVERLTGALNSLTVVCRGPKPAVLLHELGVKARIQIPEPNTWREIVPILAARSERRITIQEYGRPNLEFVDALKALGAQVNTVTIYRWDFPDELGPLEEAVRRIAARQADVVIFTTSIQLVHLFDIAGRMGLEAEVRQALARDLVIASVGPIMTAALVDQGIVPDIVPAHPKLGILVRAAAEKSAMVLERKRRRS